MFHGTVSYLSEATLKLLKWFIDRAVISWRRELRRLGRRENKWVWVGLCVIFSFILLPILADEAFSDSFLFGVSFLWSAILAISFAFVLKNPMVLIIVYIGVIFSREVTNSILGGVKDELTRGNFLGAIILFGFGVYLITWANRLKKGDV